VARSAVGRVTTVALAPLVELRVLAVTLAVIAIPGWALLSLGRSWRAYAPLQAWALALSLGIAFYPVLYALAGALPLGVALGRTALLSILVVALLVAVFQLGRDATAILRFARLEQIAGLVVLATLATRLWVAHLEPFPAWSDSLHHVLLTELTARDGRLPATMKPFFPIPLERYHLGFYALTATVQTLAGVPAHVAVTWVAQVLNGLCGLAIYLVLDRHVGRVPAVIGAVIAGLISHQPAFYVNWGRFTQLTAQTILLPAWLVTWEIICRNEGARAPSLHAAKPRGTSSDSETSSGRRQLPPSRTSHPALADARPRAARADGADRAPQAATQPLVWPAAAPPLVASALQACLLLAGVFLVHLRVAIFLVLLVALSFAAEAWRVRRDPRLRRRVLALGAGVVLGGVVLAGPRLLSTIAHYAQSHWALYLFHGGLTAPPDTRLHGDPEYFAFSLESLGYLFASGPALVALGVLLAIALWRRNRIAALFTAWSLVLLALGYAHVLGVPLLNVTNLGAVLILLYIPASLVAAAGLGELLVWRRAGAGTITAVLLAFLALGAIGARERVRQLEPSRFFVTDADLRAIDWLGRQPMSLGIGGIRATFWLPRSPHGVDAGYWIPYLVGRRTTVGPMIANLAPQYTNWMVEMSRHVAKAPDEESLRWLWQRGVRYLYLGALGDPAEAERLAGAKYLIRRYAKDGVVIFELDARAAFDGKRG